MKNIFYTVSLFFFSALTAISQNFGGEIKLKITYNDKPLVGYTITGTINKIDIGGKGVTDSQGNVTLNTEPLPVPNIDVKGVITCGNTNKSWEASGFVYVSPTSGNFYHLKLDKVAQQMSEMSGLPMGAIMESFGLNCPGALGGGSSSTTENTASNPQVNNVPQTTQNTNSSAVTENTSTQVSNSDAMKEDHDNWSENNAKKQEERKNESKQFRDDFMSNSSPSEGFQNQRNMLLSQISKIDSKISKKESELSSTSNSKDKNDLTYDIKELEVERGLKENKLQKVNASINKGNKPLNKSEKAQYKQKEAQLESDLERLKSDRKRGVSIYKESTVNTTVTQTETNVSSVQNKEVSENNNSAQKEIEIKEAVKEEVKKEEEVEVSAPIYSEVQIKNMTKMDLRTYKTDAKSKLTGKKIKYKTKSKFMDLDKKEALARDIKSLEMTIEQLEKEIELRKSK